MTVYTASQNNGRTYYTFTANRTDYTVKPRGDGMYIVYSKRQGYGSRFDFTTKVHTAAELRARSKALAGLMDMIEAEPVRAAH